MAKRENIKHAQSVVKIFPSYQGLMVNHKEISVISARAGDKKTSCVRYGWLL